MTLTLPDAIGTESFFEVSVGIQGDITTDQLSLLQSSVSDAVNEFIGVRILPTDLITRITALFILDIKQNSHGKGTIIQEAVKDNSWRASIKSSSMWMDRATSLLHNFDSSNVSKSINTDAVSRDDSRINGIVNGEPYRGRIYPYVDSLKEMSDQEMEEATGYNNIRVG